MNDWDFCIVDYWDQTIGAINKNALWLYGLNDPERESACGQISDAVRRRMDELNDRLLLEAAISMVDDLYKYVNDEVLMGQVLYDYLVAFGRTFTKTLRDRGYVIRYVVENQFSGVDFLMRGPFDLFPWVCNAAGFVYVCPQLIGLKLMQQTGIAATEYANRIAQFISEARHVGNRLVSKCQNEGQHYVFLDADYEDGALDVALRGRGDAGVLSVFRNEAPVPDSNVSVCFPKLTS